MVEELDSVIVPDRIVKVMVDWCPDCDQYVEEAMKSYNCQDDGVFPANDEGSRPNQCPNCNKFASKETDHGCPNCGVEILSDEPKFKCIVADSGDECGEYHDTEEAAKGCCVPDEEDDDEAAQRTEAEYEASATSKAKADLVPEDTVGDIG